MATRWNIIVADETDHVVRRYLTRAEGEKADLSRFVERVVRRAVFWGSVKGIRECYKDLSAAEVQALGDKAVAEDRNRELGPPRG